jgi:hypothetical protein
VRDGGTGKSGGRAAVGDGERESVGGGVACHAPAAVTSTAPWGPSVASTVSTPRSTRVRAAAAAASGSDSSTWASPPVKEASSSPLGFIRWGALSGSRSTSARSGASLVSTATQAVERRSTATSSAYHSTGAPGGSEPASTTQSAAAARRRNDSVSAASTSGVAVGPGLLSLVVVPSGSLIVRFTRRLPGWVTGQQATPRAVSSCTKGSSSGAGRTARVGTPAATQAREMLTPLPPGWEVTDAARWTEPRRSGSGRVIVLSWLGLAVRVRITRPPLRPRRGRGPDGPRPASLRR